MMEGGEAERAEPDGESECNTDDEFIPSETSRLERDRLGVENYKLGFLFIGLVVVIWVVSGFVVKGLEEQFNNSPFFITYSCTSLFSLLLVHARLCGSLRTERIEWSEVSQPVATNQQQQQRISFRQAFRGSMKIFPFWFMANFFYNWGLGLTSVTSSTILSGTSIVWTYTLGAMFGLEETTKAKLVGTALCLSGTIMVGLSDSKQDESGKAQDSNSLPGDVLTLFGAVFYAAYTLLIDYLFPGGDKSVDMAVVFGLIGVINLVCFFPVIFILDWVGLESWMSQLSFSAFLLLVLNGIFNNVISDYLFARAVLLTTPTLTSVGLSMTIPLAAILEAIIKGKAPNAMVIGGASLVCVGFLFVVLGSRAASSNNKRAASSEQLQDHL